MNVSWGESTGKPFEWRIAGPSVGRRVATDTVIIALIERDRTVFPITPDVVPVPYFVPVTARSHCAARAAANEPTPSASTGIFFTTPFRGQFFDAAEPDVTTVCAPTGARTGGRAVR